LAVSLPNLRDSIDSSWICTGVGIWELYKLIMRKGGQLKVNKNKITNCFNETGPGTGYERGIVLIQMKDHRR
jgi:hypothetical protein